MGFIDSKNYSFLQEGFLLPRIFDGQSDTGMLIY